MPTQDPPPHAYLCHFQSAFCPTLPTPPMPGASKWGQILFSNALLLVLLQGICARRESNPGHKHGRLVCCRYTTGAMTQAKKQGSGCWRLPDCPTALPSFALPNNTALQPNTRQRGDSNPCGHSPMDIWSISLATQCHACSCFPHSAQGLHIPPPWPSFTALEGPLPKFAIMCSKQTHMHDKVHLHQPGIEHGSHRWQRCILPLDH